MWVVLGKPLSPYLSLEPPLQQDEKSKPKFLRESSTFKRPKISPDLDSRLK